MLPTDRMAPLPPAAGCSGSRCTARPGPNDGQARRRCGLRGRRWPSPARPGPGPPQVVSDLPAHDHAGKKVSDESGIRKAAGRFHIGDIRDPPAVRRGGGEVPFQQVSWPEPASIRVPWSAVSCAGRPPRRSPAPRISRSTVHRATPVPSRRSCSHIFRAPYTRRPFARSSHTRIICSFSHSSRCSRGDGSRWCLFAA